MQTHRMQDIGLAHIGMHLDPLTGVKHMFAHLFIQIGDVCFADLGVGHTGKCILKRSLHNLM